MPYMRRGNLYSVGSVQFPLIEALRACSDLGGLYSHFVEGKRSMGGTRALCSYNHQKIKESKKVDSRVF
jgi:hypothetical protein